MTQPNQQQKQPKQKQILITNTAQKHLNKLQTKQKNNITVNINKLILIPWQQLDIKPLHGITEKIYRLRVGEHRILFQIKNDIITIMDVGTHNIEYRSNLK
jgi:mRNA-degrading endonuclease RelE of RelBE toxin-antitoxin system